MSEVATAPPGAKKRDYWFTVLATDPVSVPLVRFFTAHRWLTPDQVTALALFFGLAVGVAFSFGTRAGLIVGAVLFYLAFVFDCVDGKLARALDVTSARGEALDHLADGGRRASASLGLALWLWRSPDTVRSDVWFAIVYAILAYYFIEISGAQRGAPAEGLGGKLSRALAARRLLPNPGMPDVQAVVFVFGPLLGLVVPALVVGIALVSAAIAVTVVRRLRGAGV